MSNQPNTAEVAKVSEPDSDECPRCHVNIYVVDGLERAEGDVCHSCAYDVIDELQAKLAEQAQTIERLTMHICLAEHKVDQHLQGQYNNPPYPALGTALAELRAALNPKEPAK